MMGPVGAGLRAAIIDPNAFGGSLQRPELSKLALAAAAVSEPPQLSHAESKRLLRGAAAGSEGGAVISVCVGSC